MSAEQPPLPFDRWSQLSARAKGLTTEQLLDLLELEAVTLDDYLRAGPMHLTAIVAGLNSGDSTMAETHVRRAREAAANLPDEPPRPASEPPTEQQSSPAEATRVPIPALASPSYLLEPRDEPQPDRLARQGVASADETRAMPMLTLSELTGSTLPFSGATSAETVAAMLKPEEPRGIQAGPEANETALLPMLELVVPTTGSFRDKLSPLVVPNLTLPEYAELRARLTVLGEEHEPTLTRFRVAALEVRSALKARFAQIFQRDAAEQARFLAEMHAAIARVRAERDR